MTSAQQIKIIKQLKEEGALKVEVSAEGDIKVEFAPQSQFPMLVNDDGPQVEEGGELSEMDLALYSA